MNEPKITVIIPTRERCDVLEKSLKTVISQDYDNLEIIVSDNFSGDATEDIVRAAKDTRVKYLNTGKRLSMSHNWEFALSHVSDGWVTIIGDDDGLLLGSIEKIAAIIQSTSVKAIRSRCCSYSWPSSTGETNGHLVVPLTAGYEIRNSTLWLSKVMNGDADYSELPMLYTGGFVDVSVLDLLRTTDKAIYRSCIPDIYSAIAISSVIEDYMLLHDTLAIAGRSRHSNGASIGFYKKNVPEEAEYKKFLSEDNVPLHRDIPLCVDGSYPLSARALVYECYLQSRFLRPETRKCLHMQQLKVILAYSSGEFENEVSEWGKTFAKIHGLNFEKIKSKARPTRLYLKFKLFLNLITRVLNTYIMRSPKVPIKDVHEASIAAMVIKYVMPNRFKRIGQVAKRAATKWRMRLPLF